MKRDVDRAALSECKIAYVFGTASANTKKTTTFNRTPIATPAGPNNRPATTPVNVACTVWQTFTDSNNGFTHRSGCVTKANSAAPPRAPESANACALGFDTRDNPISAIERTIKHPKRMRMPTNIHQSAVVGEVAIIRLVPV
jgi:hypothetical protein